MKASRMKRPLVAWASLLSLWLAAGHGFSRSVDFEVVSSVPAETTISRAGTRDAALVWLEMISGARISIDIAEFYFSGEKGDVLEPLVAAVLEAGRRGVRVRILAEKAMAATYPETLARFRGQPGIVVRLFDWQALTGGVLHAKYFVVDGREAYVGSQNFDWRALSHIHETGLRIRSPLFAKALGRIFAADWQYSGGDRAAYRKLASEPPLSFPVDARLLASPAPFNPPGVDDALETLVRLLDQARRRVTVQLLSYSVEIGGRREDNSPRSTRRCAGRPAAACSVRLLVSNWNLRRPAGRRPARAGPGGEHRGPLRRHPAGAARFHPLCPRHPFQGHARR